MKLSNLIGLGLNKAQCAQVGMMKQQQQMSCRDMELLCRQRAVFDNEHRWKWLSEAERWEHLAQKETASRFKRIGPMSMGPNTIDGDKRGHKPVIL